MKFLNLVNGLLKQVTAITTSAGAGDANKIVATDGTGKLDITLMPTGVGADSSTIMASEALAAGDLVNLWDDAGTLKARKADASNGRKADGFVLAGVSSGASAIVYFDGTNTQQSGMTLGAIHYLSHTVPGRATTTIPTTAGHIVQQVGKALSATQLTFEPTMPTELA